MGGSCLSYKTIIDDSEELVREAKTKTLEYAEPF